MGADVIVTVRMPRTLVKALKERTEKDFYSDFSEQIRSIIRKGCLRYVNPVTGELKELKEQLKEEILLEKEDARAKALIADLKTLLERTGGGAS